MEYGVESAQSTVEHPVTDYIIPSGLFKGYSKDTAAGNDRTFLLGVIWPSYCTTGPVMIPGIRSSIMETTAHEMKCHGT